MRVELLRPAQKDLRKATDPHVAKRITNGIRAAAVGDETADVKQLSGHSPWRRLRVGDYRVLFYVAGQPEQFAMYVYRVVPRGDLESAVGRLPDLL